MSLCFRSSFAPTSLPDLLYDAYRGQFRDHPRVNEKGNTIADFNSRIKAIAAAYGIPVIDVHNCGMEVYELNHYTSDGTHPNKEGSTKMANYVTSVLLQNAWYPS